MLLVFGSRPSLQQFSRHLHWITLLQSLEVHLRTNPPRINGDRRRILQSSLANDSQPVQCSNALNILHHVRYEPPITFLTSPYPEQDLYYPDSPPILLSGSLCERQKRDSELLRSNTLALWCWYYLYLDLDSAYNNSLATYSHIYNISNYYFYTLIYNKEVHTFCLSIGLWISVEYY